MYMWILNQYTNVSKTIEYRTDDPTDLSYYRQTTTAQDLSRTVATLGLFRCMWECAQPVSVLTVFGKQTPAEVMHWQELNTVFWFPSQSFWSIIVTLGASAVCKNKLFSLSWVVPFGLEKKEAFLKLQRKTSMTCCVAPVKSPRT